MIVESETDRTEGSIRYRSGNKEMYAGTLRAIIGESIFAVGTLHNPVEVVKPILTVNGDRGNVGLSGPSPQAWG